MATAPSRSTSTAMSRPSLRIGGPRSAQGNSTSRAREDRRTDGIATAAGAFVETSRGGKGSKSGRTGGSVCRRPHPRDIRGPRGLGSSGGRAGPPRTLRVGAPRSRSIRARFAAGGRVCFPLAHPANYPHARVHPTASAPARFDRSGAHVTDATTKRARTRPIVVLRESVFNREFSSVSCDNDGNVARETSMGPVQNAHHRIVILYRANGV